MSTKFILENREKQEEKQHFCCLSNHNGKVATGIVCLLSINSYIIIKYNYKAKQWILNTYFLQSSVMEWKKNKKTPLLLEFVTAHQVLTNWRELGM